jgi:hypothetical protein
MYILKNFLQLENIAKELEENILDIYKTHKAMKSIAII